MSKIGRILRWYCLRGIVVYGRYIYRRWFRWKVHHVHRQLLCSPQIFLPFQMQQGYVPWVRLIYGVQRNRKRVHLALLSVGLRHEQTVVHSKSRRTHYIRHEYTRFSELPCTIRGKHIKDQPPEPPHYSDKWNVIEIALHRTG